MEGGGDVTNRTVSDCLTLLQENVSMLDASLPVVVGVSGGLDSVVLAHLLAGAGFDLILAHVQYGLRGKDSLGDARFPPRLSAA